MPPRGAARSLNGGPVLASYLSQLCSGHYLKARRAARLPKEIVRNEWVSFPQPTAASKPALGPRRLLHS